MYAGDGCRAGHVLRAESGLRRCACCWHWEPMSPCTGRGWTLARAGRASGLAALPALEAPDHTYTARSLFDPAPLPRSLLR